MSHKYLYKATCIITIMLLLLTMPSAVVAYGGGSGGGGGAWVAPTETEEESIFTNILFPVFNTKLFLLHLELDPTYDNFKAYPSSSIIKIIDISLSAVVGTESYIDILAYPATKKMENDFGRGVVYKELDFRTNIKNIIKQLKFKLAIPLTFANCSELKVIQNEDYVDFVCNTDNENNNIEFTVFDLSEITIVKKPTDLLLESNKTVKTGSLTGMAIVGNLNGASITKSLNQIIDNIRKQYGLFTETFGKNTEFKITGASVNNTEPNSNKISNTIQKFINYLKNIVYKKSGSNKTVNQSQAPTITNSTTT